jgi:anaerobic magnesium-protoporphyrin IX monomethyl ester cyclase
LDFNLKGLAVDKLVPKERPTDDIANDRHRSMMEAIAPYAKSSVQKNVTPVYVDYKTRKTKLVLALCPEWAPQFPPFNLARLSGVAKSAGFETHILDLNVRAYNEYKNNWQPNNRLPFRLWDPSASWHWTGGTYMNDIHPILEPLLLQACDEIEAMKPDIVGFSIYYISEEPTKWMCQELKRRMPAIKIAVGGSNVQKSWFTIHPYYDYVVSGEGEQVLLNILEEVENGVLHSEPQYLTQPEDQRININGLPMPDYESIDFSQYEIPNGVNTEISRGCTAKCTFCEETHFWKYRQRQSVDLITEIEWLYYNKGTDVIWFIDSLVNGNLKELRAFCKGVDAKGLKINWTGYARCDGRMDLEYFKDLKAGGCIMLNYGIESGSQHVLDDMAKGVTIKEMEDNFKHGKEVGIYAATNWIVGFPTETLQDFADSITLLWRMRDMNINNVGAGVGYGLGPETIVGQNPHKFNISWHKYQNHWITKDFTMGGTHVMTRVKTFHMFLDFMTGCTEVPFGYPIRFSLAKEHYKITLNNPKTIKEIEYEKFDYNIIKPNINDFADSLVNEMWPFFRMLWKTRGGYEAEVEFNPDIDLREFGSQYGPGMYNAVFKFKITDEGQWTADFKYKFEQIDNPYDDREPPPLGRKGPFFAQDYSRMMSNTAKRARKLAKPTWSDDTGRGDSDFGDLLNEEHVLNNTIDFTFQYRYRGTGDWSNYQDYEVTVADQTAVVIPEKESMYSDVTIPITSIKKRKVL